MNLKTKIYTLLFILGIVNLAMIIFVIYPLFKGIKENSQEFITQKENLALLRSEMTYLRNFEKIHMIQKDELEKINVLFANSEAPVNFISFLENTAQNCQLSITILPGGSQKSEKDPWSYLVFRISVSGTFSNFSRFLEKIENSCWLIDIFDLQIKKAKAENISANFSIKVCSK